MYDVYNTWLGNHSMDILTSMVPHFVFWWVVEFWCKVGLENIKISKFCVKRKDISVPFLEKNKNKFKVKVTGKGSTFSSYRWSILSRFLRFFSLIHSFGHCDPTKSALPDFSAPLARSYISTQLFNIKGNNLLNMAMKNRNLSRIKQKSKANAPKPSKSTKA